MRKTRRYRAGASEGVKYWGGQGKKQNAPFIFSFTPRPCQPASDGHDAEHVLRKLLGFASLITFNSVCEFLVTLQRAKIATFKML